MKIRYSILDPTGNVTALVETTVEPARQPGLAAALMRRHPAVEQVGFVRPDGPEGLPELRMAGGEFCGNASMCAATLLRLNAGEGSGDMLLRVSGASRPVALTLWTEGDGWLAEILMPPALEITGAALAYGDRRGTLPLVRLEGISHLVVEPDSAFFALLHDHAVAEQAVREFCAALNADGLGLLFLEGSGNTRSMTPLVYIPGSGTVFWENSCASGSAAVGVYLAEKTKKAAALALREPGGILRVSSDPARGETRLRGRVRLLERLEADLAE